jgi:hypothetical protein
MHLANLVRSDEAPEPQFSEEEIHANAKEQFGEDPEVQEALDYWFDHCHLALCDEALVERIKYLRERAFERAEKALEEEVDDE